MQTDQPSGHPVCTSARRGERSNLIVLFSLLLPFFPAAAQRLPPAGEVNFSTDVELVMLDVSVKNRRAGYVSGLTKDGFRIHENDVLQKITEFSTADMPVTIGLVMDTSGSMKSRRPHVITAGLAFIKDSNPLDRIFVVNFNDKVRFGLPDGVPFTDDIGLLRDALSKDVAEGQTSLYDAVAAALDRLESGQAGRKALVVVSDGGDNRSRRSLKELMRLIQESRATVYTVGIFDSDDADRNPQVLQHIARVSGGESFLPDRLDQIVPICKKIAAVFAAATLSAISRFASATTPQSQNSGNCYSAGSRKLTVRTRTSYQLPIVSTGGRYPDPVK